MNDISAYYDSVAPDYDRSRFDNSYGQFIHSQEYGALTRMLNGTPPAYTLDLACGTGRLLGLAGTGFDLSARMLAEARRKFPDKNLVAGDATRLPFPDASFDAVFSLHFLMHLNREQTQAVLAEAWRVLRPGGRLVVDFPSGKRRQFTGGHHYQNWHGSNAGTLKEWQSMTAEQWQTIDIQGVLFFPMHRLHPRLRMPLLPFDTWLCRSFLKEYASYLMLCLLKK